MHIYIIYIYIYIYIYTYMHTYIHTYVYIYICVLHIQHADHLGLGSAPRVCFVTSRFDGGRRAFTLYLHCTIIYIIVI